MANTTLLACGSGDSDSGGGTGGTSAAGSGGSSAGSGGSSAGSGGSSAGSGGSSAGSGGSSAGSGGSSAGGAAGSGGTSGAGTGGTTSSGNWTCINPSALQCFCTDGGSAAKTCTAASYPCCILFPEPATGPDNKCQCTQGDATACGSAATALKGKKVAACPP